MGWQPRDPNAYEVPIDNSHPEVGLFHCPLPLGGSIVVLPPIARGQSDELSRIAAEEEKKAGAFEVAGAAGAQRPLTKEHSIRLH